MMRDSQHNSFPRQEYQAGECAVFWKTREQFGGLSNMAGGWPLRVHGIPVPSSEALYQACRFPDRLDVQKRIITQSSPMAAKMVSKPYRGEEDRPNWDNVRVEVMDWCLRVKLAQHWGRFSKLLLSTGDRPIVERSRRDDFWGAKLSPDDTKTLVGQNVLGCLLEDLRTQVRETPEAVRNMPPPPPVLADFRLLQSPKAENVHTVRHAPSFPMARSNRPVLALGRE